jgi:omega-amidase
MASLDAPRESESAPLRVVGVQIANSDATTGTARSANLKRAKELVRERAAAAVASKSEVDVYVLPELSAVGYSDSVMDVIRREHAENGQAVVENADDVLLEDAEDGPSFQCFSALAREVGAFIVYGFPRRGRGGRRPTISQGVVNQEGELVAVYDKLHLCSFGDCAEGGLFESGDHLTVFTVRGFRVGILICYDLRFPALWARLAKREDCDVILHPSAFPDDGSFASWHLFVRTRAIENAVSVLSVSRAHPHFGCSIAVGPAPPEAVSGSAVLSRREGTIDLVVDKEEMREARREYAFRRDERDDYETIEVGGVPT